MSKITQQVGDMSGSDSKLEYSADHDDFFFTCTIGETPALFMLLHVHAIHGERVEKTKFIFWNQTS